MEEKVIAKINVLIARLVKEYNETGKFNEAGNERVCGMLETLEMFTGKSYKYDESGVHENKC